MDVGKLIDLIREFASKTTTIRGRRVNQELIFLSFGPDGDAQFKAVLELPGHGTAQGVVKGLLADAHGVESEIFCDCATTAQVERVLLGEIEPRWFYADEEVENS